MTPEHSPGAAEAHREPWTWHTVEERLIQMGLAKFSETKFRNETVLIELSRSGNDAGRWLHVFTKEGGASSYSTTDQGAYVRPEDVIAEVIARTATILNASPELLTHDAGANQLPITSDHNQSTPDAK